jgi:hypothetical protein
VKFIPEVSARALTEFGVEWRIAQRAAEEAVRVAGTATSPLLINWVVYNTLRVTHGQKVIPPFQSP